MKVTQDAVQAAVMTLKQYASENVKTVPGNVEAVLDADNVETAMGEITSLLESLFSMQLQ